MSWSQAEILALATKAARGAGAPAGQAQRFGQAAVQHLLRDAGPDELLHALEALPEGEIMNAPVEIDAVLAEATGDVVDITPDVPSALFESYLLSLPFDVGRRDLGRRTAFSVNCAVPAASNRGRRLDASAQLVARLHRFAEATFVPETEASRSSGAGAGLDDND